MSKIETIKLSSELSEAIDAFAADQGLDRYDAIAALLNRGLRKVLSDEEARERLDAG